jgi:hypothetical protein
VETTGFEMKKFWLAAAALVAMSGTGMAASVTNRDAQAHTIVVTEGGSKSEIAVGAGETVEFCQTGCFVTMPNGDRLPLGGSEVIEISGGAGTIQ